MSTASVPAKGRARALTKGESYKKCHLKRGPVDCRSSRNSSRSSSPLSAHQNNGSQVQRSKGSQRVCSCKHIMHPGGAWLGSMLIVNDNGWTTIMQSSVLRTYVRTSPLMCNVSRTTVMSVIPSILANPDADDPIDDDEVSHKHCNRIPPTYVCTYNNCYLPPPLLLLFPLSLSG